MFSLTNGTWTPLKQMKECRQGASSVVHNNHIFISGGNAGDLNWIKSVEKLSLNAVQVELSKAWENVFVQLPGRVWADCSVVYNGRLIVIGGYDADKRCYSDGITENSLVSPHTKKLLATTPQRKGFHGVAIFGDKIMIVGGRETGFSYSTLRSVVMYDIMKTEFQQLAPLPYPVDDLATVKWGDENVMIMGGANNNNQALYKVLMYNIKTQKSHELPIASHARTKPTLFS